MPGMDAAHIEELARYESQGWVLVALPPEIASLVVGMPATQDRAMMLSTRIRAMEEQIKLLGGTPDA